MVPVGEVSGSVTAPPTGNELGGCGDCEAAPAEEVDIGPALVAAGLPGEQADKTASDTAAGKV